MVHEATITVYVGGCRWTEVFVGNEENIHNEAYDFMQTLCARYIADNRVPEEEQNAVIDGAYYELSWIEEPCIEMYAVLDRENEEPVLGVYLTRADAEEAAFDFAEEWVYKVLMTDDPMDVLGQSEWNYAADYRYLMNDALDSLEIIPTCSYDVKESDL